MAVPIVTFLVSRFPNPSETFIQAQAEGLLERGMEVDIVAMARGDCRELLAKWGGRLRVHNVRLGKSLLSRLPGAIEAGFGATSRAAFNPIRFGYDGLSWRLPVAAA